MQPVRQFFGKIFLNDGVLRALPMLTLLAGTVLFTLAFTAWPDADAPVTHDILKSLSQTILAGGLVGVLTNSFKYMGIFRDTVHDVVYGQEHLKSRNDLPQLWSRITSVLCQEKFPQLTEHLQIDVLKKYIPTKKDFYYSQYSRECTISFEDDDQRIVVIYEELDLVVHPHSPTKEISYTYRGQIDSRTPAGVGLLDIHEFTIDGIDHGVPMISEPYQDEFGGMGVKQSYAISLSGKDKYRIRRSASRRVCIASDPIMEFSSNEFILGSTVKFRSTDRRILPIFQSVGTEDFDDCTMGRTANWHVHREFQGLMFPDQGYILFIQRQL